MSLLTSSTPAPSPTPGWSPLTGGTAVWVFMSVEVLTFGLFLLGHAWGWRSDPEGHAAGQALLHVRSGLVGTVLLLLGSGLAYLAVLAEEQGQTRRTIVAFLAAAACGLAFSVNKLAEYASPDLAEVGLSTSAFWFSYLFLTGLHLLHVVLGVVLLAWVAWRLARGGPGPTLGVAAVAAYWHLVDVIWLLLFPIVYLMHP